MNLAPLDLGYSPNGLFSLCLPNLGFLVSLGEDVTECGAGDVTLMFDNAPCTFTALFLLQTLLVLPPVQHSPADLTRVALSYVQTLTFGVQEDETLRRDKAEIVG